MQGAQVPDVKSSVRIRPRPNLEKTPQITFGFTAQEIIREGRVTLEEITTIRSWLMTQPNLPRLTDEQITFFLLSTRNDEEKTKLTIERHYFIKKSAPRLFNDRKCSRADLQLQMKTYQFGVLPKRTEDGYAIIFCRLRDTYYANAILEPSLVLCFMTMEASLYDHPPTGLIVILDQKGTSLLHLTQIRIGLIKTCMEFIQEGLQAMVKKIHIMNTVPFIDKLMAVVKPFMNKESYDMLHFHPPKLDMETFHARWISKDCLPVEYGGDLPSAEIFHQQNITKLKEMEGYFDAEESQRSMKYIVNEIV